MDVVLVDAKNCVYRHGFTRAHLKTADGKYTGALFGVLSCLIRLSRYYPKAAFVFCWDGEETFKSWRHSICKTYKCKRAKKPSDVPPEVGIILKQIPLIKKILTILGFAQFEVANLEADDLIGVIASSLYKRSDVKRVLIYSMDKDYYGLVNKKIQVVRDLDKSSQCEALQAAGIKKKFGVHPRDWVKYRALIGDPSDSIKSPLPKVGKVRALKLLKEGLDPSNKIPISKLEKKYNEHWKNVHMNYRISKIVTDHKFKHLPAHAKEALKVIVKRVDKSLSCIRRNNKCHDKLHYKRFLQLCSDYELHWIIEHRDDIWRLGW